MKTNLKLQKQISSKLNRKLISQNLWAARDICFFLCFFGNVFWNLGNLLFSALNKKRNVSWSSKWVFENIILTIPSPANKSDRPRYSLLSSRDTFSLVSTNCRFAKRSTWNHRRSVEYRGMSWLCFRITADPGKR